ncbi:MAG: acyltransferase [Acidimicrobiia bacterium]
MSGPEPGMDPEALGQLLQELYRRRDEELRAAFDRSLSFTDGLFDRWERARRLGFAEGASIYNSSLVFGDVTVGERTWVGPYTLLDGSGGGLRIGAYCSISTGAHIYTHDTIMWSLSGGRVPPVRAGVTIGDRCYVGSQSVVAAGVEIGDECVLAANCFVNRPVPARSIVGGTPAQIIGRVEHAGGEISLVFER